MRVEAFVPHGKLLTDIHTRISRKVPRIVRQVQFFDQYHPLQPPREYVNGETHYYLGRQYRLRIISGTQRSVKLVGKHFNVVVQAIDDSKAVRSLMKDWYRTHARDIFLRRIDDHYPFFKKRGCFYPKLILRYMQKRWGSCLENGTVTLNTELIKAPMICIDYVVVHELCHLVCPNHDKQFYRLMTSAMPEWKRWKDRLERTVVG